MSEWIVLKMLGFLFECFNTQNSKNLNQSHPSSISRSRSLCFSFTASPRNLGVKTKCNAVYRINCGCKARIQKWRESGRRMPSSRLERGSWDREAEGSGKKRRKDKIGGTKQGRAAGVLRCY